MNTVENTVGGTYREGRIVLDRPMNWTEGTRVVVQLLDEENGLIDGVWPADGSPEGEAEILRRMQAPEPEEITREDRKAFAAAIDEVRRFFRQGPNRKTDEKP
jgi:hypothetical protein